MDTTVAVMHTWWFRSHALTLDIKISLTLYLEIEHLAQKQSGGLFNLFIFFLNNLYLILILI